MVYQPFTHKGKKYKADDLGKGVMYISIDADALKLVFTDSGISVEEWGLEQKKSTEKLRSEIDSSYNLCVECDGLKCNTDIVETNCGNLKKEG